MVKPTMKIVFENSAKIALREAYNFIKKDFFPKCGKG